MNTKDFNFGLYIGGGIVFMLIGCLEYSFNKVGIGFILCLIGFVFNKVNIKQTKLEDLKK